MIPRYSDLAPPLRRLVQGAPEALDLNRPIYARTSAYGHFGREDTDFTWENTDKAETLKAAAG